MTASPVLICGAGPVGLVLAITLRRLGIQCRVIDKRTTVDPSSKALSINPASLELFEDLGFIAAVLDRGWPNDRIHVQWKRRELYTLSLSDLPGQYPYFLMLPQCTTELILREQFALLGGNVESGRELVAIRPDGDRLVAGIRDDSGRVKDEVELVARGLRRSS